MEAAIAQSRDLLRVVIDAIPAPISVKDTAGRFLLANQRVSDLFGVDVRQIIGRRMDELPMTHIAPDARADFVATSDRWEGELRRTGQPVLNRERSSRRDRKSTRLNSSH